MSKISFSPEEFNQARTEAETFYKQLNSISCPYLGEHINFNAKGLDHIKLTRWNHARPQKDQYVRFKLLKLVPEVLKQSHTLQGFLRKNNFERQKINSRWEQHMKEVTYYEFIAVINSARVRVIVKQIEGGGEIFLEPCSLLETVTSWETYS